MLELGLVRQLRHAGACTHMEWVGRVDTIVCVTVRSKIQYHTNDYRSQVEGEGGGVPHCNWVRRRVVDAACHLAYLHFPSVEGRPPDGTLPGSHQLHEGSNVQYAWLDDDNEWDAQCAPPGHVAGGELEDIYLLG